MPPGHDRRQRRGDQRRVAGPRAGPLRRGQRGRRGRLPELLDLRHPWHDRAQAGQDRGREPVTIGSQADDHKAYCPGSHRISMRFTGDRGTGRLQGVQLFGHRHAEIAKRIDSAATAIFHGMTIDAVSDLVLVLHAPSAAPGKPSRWAPRPGRVTPGATNADFRTGGSGQRSGDFVADGASAHQGTGVTVA